MKMKDLDCELFIEDLGKVRGGSVMTTMALGEESGDGPTTLMEGEEGGQLDWHTDLVERIQGLVGDLVDGAQPQPVMTTYALGEES